MIKVNMIGYQKLPPVAHIKCLGDKESFLICNPSDINKYQVFPCKIPDTSSFKVLGLSRGLICLLNKEEQENNSSFKDSIKEEWKKREVEIAYSYTASIAKEDKKPHHYLLMLSKENSHPIPKPFEMTIMSEIENRLQGTCFKLSECRLDVRLIQGSQSVCLCNSGQYETMNRWLFTQKNSQTYELDFEKSGIPEKRASLLPETTPMQFLRDVYNMFEPNADVSPVEAFTFHSQAMRDEVGDDGKNVFITLSHAGEISEKETLRFFLIQGKRCRQGKKLWKLEALSGDLKKRFGSLQLTLEKA